MAAKPLSEMDFFMLKINKSNTNLMLIIAGLFAVAVAQAGTTGTEFEELHTLLTGWANGYLGKALAVAAFLFGAGYGVAKQTIVPAILGIVFALVFAIGPGVIEGMLTATI